MGPRSEATRVRVGWPRTCCCYYLAVLAMLMMVGARPVSKVAAAAACRRLRVGAATACFLTRPSQPPPTRLSLRDRGARAPLRTMMVMKAGAEGQEEQQQSVAVTLLLSSTEDPASVNLCAALIDRGGWEAGAAIVEDGRCWVHRGGGGEVWLWQIDKGFLREDHLDVRWTTATGKPLTDVVFLSRHAAQSGRASLTLHPIGNPGTAPPPPPPTVCGGEEEAAAVLPPQYGGRWGRCVPPSPRLADWFRRLQRLASQRRPEVGQQYEVALEATHHGPWLETPSMFVEVGSMEEHWTRKDAAQAWAQVIHEALGLDKEEEEGDAEEEAQAGDGPVVLGLGGGHYAPRFMDLLRQRPDVRLGHVLASYALDFTGLQGGGWREAVDEALTATRAAYSSSPPPQVVAYLDRKAFKGADRERLLSFLRDERGVTAVLKATDIPP